MRAILTALLPGIALWLWSRSGAGVESIYAARIYPLVARPLQALTGLVPTSLFEILVFTGAIALLAALGRALYRRRLRAWLRSVLLLAAGLYAAFMLAWGMNYGRAPLSEQQGWSVGSKDSIRDEEVRALTARLAAALSDAWAALPPEIASDEGSRMPYDRRTLKVYIDRGYASLGWLTFAPAREWVSPDPKPVHLLFYPFPAAGMFSPWTSEAQYDATLPDPSLPFTIAHELAHARGYAREDEANLLAFAAGLGAQDPYLRYGALRSGFNYMVNALDNFDRPAAKALRAQIPEGVRADNRAVSAHWDKKPKLTLDLGEKTYDAYLKSQGVADGRRSYSQVVRLLVGLDRAGEISLDMSR